MTPAELALTAALGASALTGAASLGVMWLQEWRRSQASDRDALYSAVLQLLTRSIAVALRADAMRNAIRFRSGLMEGVDIVLLRLHKPVDALELYDWQAPDLVPLNAALNEVWTRWDQEGIRLANDLVNKCVDLLGASVALAPASTIRQRLRKAIIGERWTLQMQDEHDRARQDMLQARRRLAEYARATLKLDTADLAAQVEAVGGQDSPKALPPGSKQGAYPRLGAEREV
jgi:hypothetical protein